MEKSLATNTGITALKIRTVRKFILLGLIGGKEDSASIFFGKTGKLRTVLIPNNTKLSGGNLPKYPAD